MLEQAPLNTSAPANLYKLQKLLSIGMSAPGLSELLTSLKLINLTYLVKMKEYILFILKTDMFRVRFQDFNL